MSSELIYTSSQQGLKQGSRGFCTVAVTAGLSRAIAGKMEMLSGYEFAYPLSDSNYHHNPVNFAHTIISVANRSQHVLSRVAASGTDYTGRANKIAHHILLTGEDLHPAGPAWMIQQIQQNRLFREVWQQAPCELPYGHITEQLPRTDQAGVQLANWQTLTGDPGWAGWLIEQYRNDPENPVFIIYQPGLPVLDLFVEALRLLPSEERWQVGFATYYTQLPTGCHYHWRALIKGSRAQQEIERYRAPQVIDLTGPLPPLTSASRYVAAARQGRAPAPITQTARSQPPGEKNSYDPSLYDTTAPVDDDLFGLRDLQQTQADEETPVYWSAARRNHNNQILQILWILVPVFVLVISIIIWSIIRSHQSDRVPDTHDLESQMTDNASASEQNKPPRALDTHSQPLAIPAKTDQTSQNHSSNPGRSDSNIKNVNSEGLPPLESRLRTKPNDSEFPAGYDKIVLYGNPETIDLGRSVAVYERINKLKNVATGSAGGSISHAIHQSQLAITIPLPSNNIALPRLGTIEYAIDESQGHRILRHLSHDPGTESWLNYYVLEFVSDSEKKVFQYRKQPPYTLTGICFPGQSTVITVDDYPAQSLLCIDHKDNTVYRDSQDEYQLTCRLKNNGQIDIEIEDTHGMINRACRYETDKIESNRLQEEIAREESAARKNQDLVADLKTQLRRLQEAHAEIPQPSYQAISGKLRKETIPVIDAWGLPVANIALSLREINQP